jgi:hypothetical protein
MSSAAANAEAATLAPEPVVASRARTRERGREVDRHVAAGEALPQRCLVEDVGRGDLGAARSREGRGIGPAHQRAHPVARGGESRDRMAAVDTRRADDGDALAHGLSARAFAPAG